MFDAYDVLIGGQKFPGFYPVQRRKGAKVIAEKFMSFQAELKAQHVIPDRIVPDRIESNHDMSFRAELKKRDFFSVLTRNPKFQKLWRSLKLVSGGGSFGMICMG